MSKYKEIYGVDISKDVYDVYGSLAGHHQFKNDEKGFIQFEKSIPKDSLVVMEATGYYHYRLAQFLYKKGVAVSVVNPLSVKRFIQMKLAKVKTDKSDAKAICEYGQMNEVPLYTALTDVQSECLQLFRLLDSYLKKRTATKNKLHGEEVLGIPSKFVYRSLKRNLKHLDKEVAEIDQRLLDLVKKEQQQQLTLLKSIPGLGVKTALFLIVVTDGFSKFETASQLCSYVGIRQEIEERTYWFPWRQHQFVSRTFAERKLGKGWNAGLGFTYFLQSLPHNPEITDYTNQSELRPQLEIAYNQSISEKLSISHRYWSEFRFFEQPNGYFEYGNNRTRYKIEIRYTPVQKLTLKAFDEIHINIGGKIVQNVFDQNRYGASVQYMPMENLGFELGYFNWYQQRKSGADFYNRHIVRFTIHHTINYKKSKNQ